MAGKTEENTAYRELIERARQAAERAYCPYSNYRVGAAVLTFDGMIHEGCNIENAGYSQTIHAEETAVSSAIASGLLERARQAGLSQFEAIRALAVHAPLGSDPWPCCNCRQFLCEFGLEFDIIGAGEDGAILCQKLEALIPYPFPVETVLAAVRRGR